MTAPLVVLLLAAPVLLLASAVVALAAYGPLGWLAGAALVGAVAAGTRVGCRRCWVWWLGTKAAALAPGERPPGQRYRS